MFSNLLRKTYENGSGGGGGSVGRGQCSCASLGAGRRFASSDVNGEGRRLGRDDRGTEWKKLMVVSGI